MLNRRIVIGRVWVDRYVEIANRGNPWGLVASWRGHGSVFQETAFFTWRELWVTAVHRCELAGLKASDPACAPTERRGEYCLTVRVRRLTNPWRKREWRAFLKRGK